MELASLYAIACCLLVRVSGEAVRFELCEELLVNEGLLQMKGHVCRGLKLLFFFCFNHTVFTLIRV
jgi:hypothetical protein